MKSYKLVSAFVAVALCICGCGNEDESVKESLYRIVDGNLVAIPLSIDIQEDADDVTRATAEDTVRFIQDLNDDFYMETTIALDRTPRTRSANDLLDGAKMLMVAYRLGSTAPYKYQILTMSSSTAPEIYLPQGEHFKLVLYTRNTTTLNAADFLDLHGGTSTPVNSGSYGYLLPTGTTFKSQTEVHGTDAMFAQVDDTGEISTSNDIPVISFGHLFSRIYWVMTSEGGGDITACSAEIHQAYEKATVDLTNATNWTGINDYSFNLTWMSKTSNPNEITTDKIVFCPNTSYPASENIVLNSITFNSNGNTFVLAPDYKLMQQFVRGKSYKISTKFRRNATILIRLRGAGTPTDGTQTSTGNGATVTGAGNKVTVTNVGSYTTKDFSTNYLDGVTATAIFTKGDGWYFSGWYEVQSLTSTKTTSRLISGTRLASGAAYTGRDSECAYVDGTDGMTLHVKEVRDGYIYEARFIKWANSNIYWDSTNKKLIFDTGNTVDPMTQGVFFKWGSLVGISPAEYNGRAWSDDAPIYVPDENASSGWEETTNTNSMNGTRWQGSGYSSIPYEASIVAVENDTVCLSLTDNTSLYALYQGDICRYISEKEKATGNTNFVGTWRLPSSGEFNPDNVSATAIPWNTSSVPWRNGGSRTWVTSTSDGKTVLTNYFLVL